MIHLMHCTNSSIKDCSHNIQSSYAELVFIFRSYYSMSSLLVLLSKSNFIFFPQACKVKLTICFLLHLNIYKPQEHLYVTITSNDFISTSMSVWPKHSRSFVINSSIIFYFLKNLSYAILIFFFQSYTSLAFQDVLIGS